MQRTLEKNIIFFSCPHQTLPRKCTPASVWAKLVLDTDPALLQAKCTAQPSLSTFERTFVAQCPLSFPCLPLMAHGSCFQGCYFAHSEIFFFQSLHFNYTCSFSKGWMFWDNEIFPQVMLLSLPLDSSVNRKLPVSRRKLSWFLYSCNLLSPKPLANLLFIFQGYKN